MDVSHSCSDILSKLELTAALGDLDSSDFAGPRIHILQQMSVNGLQMIEVEMTCWNTFSSALRDKLSLDKIEFGCV